ncbi:hypothetical protein C8J57DRAFT_1497106 [Mycena rebaudengoi]|nr:hypothetical protein C8J57DRAFT_1497106 [Mycena rebaudengoi]
MFRVSHQEPDRLSLRVITTAECEIIRVINQLPSFTVEQNNDSPPDRLSPPATSGSAPPKDVFQHIHRPGSPWYPQHDVSHFTLFL